MQYINWEKVLRRLDFFLLPHCVIYSSDGFNITRVRCFDLRVGR
jgi:hypothetical protein